DVFQALLKEDRERFHSALVRAGIDPALRDSAGYEPIFSLAERFEQPLNLAQTAAEFGLRPDAMLAALASSDDLEDIGARLRGIDLPRQQFAEYFEDLREAANGYRDTAELLTSFENGGYGNGAQRLTQTAEAGIERVAAAPQANTEDIEASDSDASAEGGTAAAKIEEIRVPEGDVSAVQTELRRLGYDPGPVDGELGPKTREAIRDFEEDVRRKTTVSLKEVELLLRLGKLG
ncbi:MAG: peptidoglycan-binding protein, partial [Alphaproteobacteria bacterium]